MYLRTATYVLYARRGPVYTNPENKLKCQRERDPRYFPRSRSKTSRSKTQVSEGEGPTSSPRSKTQVSEGEGPTPSPRSKTQVSGARRYDICTVPRPLVPTSPVPVPTNPHKALVNVATAEVPRVMTARSSSAHSSPRTPAFKPQVASALLSS